jgi:alpha-methylacyl-CoA racemase
MAGPLAGLRIVEMDAIGPVPLACTILADMGAEIIRVARPPHPGAAWDDVGGSVLHRSRTAVYADLKAPADLAKVETLIGAADALIEGFRPGVMERLGLGPEPCLTRNPRLVFTRMTGWGQSGPLTPRAGHDINYIAVAGALHGIGNAGAPPVVPLNLIGDYGGGAMFAIAGMLAGLHSARCTGRGQIVDVAMTDGIASLMSLFHAFTASGLWQDQPQSNLLDGAAPFYRCYTCADGGYVAVGALEPQFFAQLLAGLEIEADRYPRQNNPAGWPAMERDFTLAFAARPRDEWTRLFEGSDACVSPVLSLHEAPGHPHNQARNSYIYRAGHVQPAPAPRFSETQSEASESIEQTLDEAVAHWTNALKDMR